MGERVHADPAKSTPQSAREKPQTKPATSVPQTSGLAAPLSFDIGDRAVDTVYRSSLYVSNLETSNAAVNIRYEGSPAIFLEQAPTYFRPIRDGFDPSAGVGFAFKPPSKGHYKGKVTIESQWVTRGPMTTEVEISAASHEVGAPDLADEELAERDAAAARQKRNEDEKVSADAAKEADRRLDRNQLFGTAGSRERLQHVSEDVAAQMAGLGNNRGTGVDTAQLEAAMYLQRETPVEPSLLEKLAFAGLEVASVGIAGAVGKLIEEALHKEVVVAAHTMFTHAEKIEEHVAHGPSKALVAFFTESISEVTSNAEKAGVHALEAKHSAHAKNLSSEIPMIQFFQKEKVAVVNNNVENAHKVAQQSRTFFEPMLDRDPKRAISALETISAGIRELVASNSTADLQAEQSALHWARYIAGTSLGTTGRAHGHADPEGLPTAKITDVNRAPSLEGKMTHRAGLVDIEFIADMDPSKPLSIVGVRLNGLSKGTLARVARNLDTAKLPIRAYSSRGTVRLEIIRDEAGNIEMADETGAPGMDGHWFQSRSGEPHAGVDVAKRSAANVLREVLAAAAAALDSESEKKMEIEGDSVQ